MQRGSGGAGAGARPLKTLHCEHTARGTFGSLPNMEEIDVAIMGRAHMSLDEIKQQRATRLHTERKHAKQLAEAVEDGGGGGDAMAHSETASCSGSSIDSARSSQSMSAGQRSPRQEVSPASSIMPPMVVGLNRSASASTTSLDSQATRLNAPVGTLSRKRPASAGASSSSNYRRRPSLPDRRSELVDTGGYDSGDGDTMGGHPVFRMSAGPKLSTRSVPWA